MRQRRKADIRGGPGKAKLGHRLNNPNRHARVLGLSGGWPDPHRDRAQNGAGPQFLSSRVFAVAWLLDL